MINSGNFYSHLVNSDVTFFCGVPDSLLKDICAYITDHTSEDQHIITSNEGNSIGLAIGYHLSTGNIPMVYLQNSGIGNTINPLISLADEDVYGIPMLLMIGWRGAPGIKDEPQHVKQGKIMEPLLDSLEIPCVVLNSTCNWQKEVNHAIKQTKDLGKPVALLIEKGTFEKYSLQKVETSSALMKREEAIRVIVEQLDDESVIVSTTGMTSRELFEIRVQRNERHDKDFLTVGGMGHTSQIALGIAIGCPQKKIFCLDGDGSVIMHMGALAIIGTRNQHNFFHIVLNNNAHDSVGGQPTVAEKINLTEIAKNCGYNRVFKCSNLDDLKTTMKQFSELNGPVFLEVEVAKGARNDLGRPTTTPKHNKEELMRFLQS